MSVLASVTDPQGRVVELTAERWAHILEGRGSAAPAQDEVLRAVRAPDDVLDGHEANELWYYLAGVGPSRWLRVVVPYEQGRGWIVTAFPRRSKP